MAVTAYTGLPGSGKSHSVVEFVILPALRAGRTVVTNLALRVEIIQKDFPAADVRLIDSDSIKADASFLSMNVVPGAVLVIDEAQLVWPAGLRAKDVPEAVVSFFTEHRHRVDAKGRSSDIVLVTQNLSNVAMFARTLVAGTFRSVALDELGTTKRFRVDVYKGPALGPSPPEKTRVRQIFGKYREKVWRYYNSHTQRDGDGTHVDESSLDKRNVVWRSPWLIGGAVAGLVLGVFGVVSVLRFFNPEPEAPRGQPQTVSSGAALPSRAGGVVPPSRWRISGEIIGGIEDLVMLTDGQRSVTLPFDAYCDRDASGYIFCQWQGGEVSNQVRTARAPASMAPAAATVFGPQTPSAP